MGTLTLNKDGFGTVHDRFLQINHQAVDVGQKPINEWEGDCQVSYEAQADGTFLMLFYNCISQNVSGHGYPGMSGSDSNYWTAVQVKSDALLFSMTDPYITDQWNFFTGQQPAYAERICSGSRTAIRIR